LMGTLVKSGNGAGIVVGTGPQTEFGVVFGIMQEVEERKTPLQLSMDELAKKLSAISFGYRRDLLDRIMAETQLAGNVYRWGITCRCRHP